MSKNNVWWDETMTRVSKVGFEKSPNELVRNAHSRPDRIKTSLTLIIISADR